MNREEAKYILRAYRRSGQDASDPLFEEALQLARQDFALAEWFEGEQSFDAAIGAKLGTVPVRAELKHQLLALRRVIRPAPWWQRPGVLSSIAAVFVGLSALGGFFFTRFERSELAQLRTVLVQATLNTSKHVDVEGLNNADLRHWIGEHGGSHEFELPRGISNTSVAGCKIIDWREQKITFLCLMPGGKHYDLFVVAEAGLWRNLIKSTPQFRSENGITVVVWRHDDKAYFLTGASAKAEMEKLL